MSKLKIEYIDAYRRMSNYSPITFAGSTGVVRLSHNKNEIVYIVPIGEGDYECERHYCNVMSESEFNKEYALKKGK